MKQGDHVEHCTGGARGIYHAKNRVFLKDWIYGCAHWEPNELRPVAEPPSDELWSKYCAWQLVTEGERR